MATIDTQIKRATLHIDFSAPGDVQLTGGLSVVMKIGNTEKEVAIPCEAGVVLEMLGELLAGPQEATPYPEQAEFGGDYNEATEEKMWGKPAAQAEPPAPPEPENILNAPLFFPKSWSGKAIQPGEKKRARDPFSPGMDHGGNPVIAVDGAATSVAVEEL
jgi:hypothetical protein